MADTPAPPGPTVLIVKEQGGARERYVALLNAAGLSTAEIDTPAQAIRRLEAIRPQVIVTDLRLASGADGLDLCDRLKHNPTTRDIPVIVLTGAPWDKHLERRAEAAGCALLLLKPQEPSALVTEVLRLTQ
jgi:CheY-like chemotaxis protein